MCALFCIYIDNYKLRLKVLINMFAFFLPRITGLGKNFQREVGIGGVYEGGGPQYLTVTSLV